MNNEETGNTSLKQSKEESLQQLSQFQDELEDLLACNQFYREAVQAIVMPEDIEDCEPWHTGLFATGKKLQKSGEVILENLVNIRQSIQCNNPEPT